MKLSSAEFKKLARANLYGKYGTFIGSYVIFQIIYFATLGIVRLFFNNDSYMGLALKTLINLIIFLVFAVFTAGFSYQALKFSRGEEVAINDIFYGFSHHPDRYIIVTILQGLIMLVCLIPTIVAMIFATINYITNVYLSSGAILVLVIMALIGYILAFIMALGFSLSLFLIIDNAEMGAIESLKTSWLIMKGNKKRLLYISLSFIGLTILGVMSLGIGLLWLVPYMNVTSAYFYREVIGDLTPSQL